MIKQILSFFLVQNILLADDGSLAEKASYLHGVPKAELHLHLSGSYPKEYLFSIASQSQKEELERNLDLIAKGLDYHVAFPVFQIIHQIVNTEEKVQRGVEELCLSLQDDGVTYVEIRTGLKDLGNGLEAYLTAVLDGIQAKASEKLKANVIVSVQRSSSLEIAKKTVDLAIQYQEKGVIGIDISGDSTIGQVNLILPELLRAKESGLNFVIHVGESPKETDQIFLLEALTPARVGHGVHLSKEAKDWILSHRTPVEVCLTSSVLVQMIGRYDEHPGIALFKMGHPIALCTDDPLLFSTTLTKEFLLAHHLIGLSIEEIEQLSNDAFDYSLR